MNSAGRAFSYATRTGTNLICRALQRRSVTRTTVVESTATISLPKNVNNLKEKRSEQSSEVLQLDLIHHLERTSLVNFDSSEALRRLNEAINFAEQLFEVNTEGVEPLVSVLENESLHLRDDFVTENKRQDILKNASIIEEDYFVAPPGNIPLEPSSTMKH